MTLEDQHTNRAGFSRRTALKAAAWSVPVIAAATAVPAYAASGETVDLQVGWMQSGDVFQGYNADKSRMYSVTKPTGVEITNAGSVDVAAGSLLTMRYDARIFGPEAGAFIDDTELPAAGTQTANGVTTASFSLPAFPVAGPEVTVRAGMPLLTDPESMPWFEDIVGYSVTVTPSGAVDATPDDNTVATETHYEDTTDGTVTATWTTGTVPNSQDPSAPHEIDIPETITITSLAPGATVTKVQFEVGLPQANDAEGNYAGRLLESFTVTSALLDGTDVTSSVSPVHPDAPGHLQIDGPSFAPGQTLELVVDVALISDAVHSITNNGGTQVYVTVAGDRESDNNAALGPRWFS